MINQLSYRGFALIGLLTGLIMIQACGRPVEQETSCNFVQNQNMQRVSWERPQIINLYIDNSVPVLYVEGIAKAVEHWNINGEKNFGGKFFNLVRQSAGEIEPARDGYSKIYVRNTWESNKQNEQARTTIYWSGDRIYEADIRINEKDFDFFIGETPDYGKVHMESLMIHELGHVLGLAHTDDHTSVMQVSLANGRLRDNLGRYDMESMQCEYSAN